MRVFVLLFVYLIATVARLAGSGGIRSVIAESVLVKHQLLILNRSRKRAPNLCVFDRIVASVCVLLMRPTRVLRSAIVLKPSTLLQLHHLLKKTKSTACCFHPNAGVSPARMGPARNSLKPWST
jgi:putative transposase